MLIFNNMLRKLSKTFAPKYMAAVFESPGKTHREEEYAEYKANRTETPPDLIEQIPYVRRLHRSPAHSDPCNTPGLKPTT